ncbi:MAG: MFS transporter, partial [Chloroflexi bacterium]
MAWFRNGAHRRRAGDARPSSPLLRNLHTDRPGHPDRSRGRDRTSPRGRDRELVRRPGLAGLPQASARIHVRIQLIQKELMTVTRIRNHPMTALSVLVLGLFMTLLDLTIVNIAIPSLVDGLHASLDQVLWVLNAYSLLYAVLLITSARLGDIYGPRNLFAAGVVIFTA